MKAARRKVPFHGLVQQEGRLLDLPIFQLQSDDRREVSTVVSYQDEIMCPRCRGDQESHWRDVLAATYQVRADESVAQRARDMFPAVRKDGVDRGEEVVPIRKPSSGIGWVGPSSLRSDRDQPSHRLAATADRDCFFPVGHPTQEVRKIPLCLGNVHAHFLHGVSKERI
jgi:hypothetical protein